MAVATPNTDEVQEIHVTYLINPSTFWVLHPDVDELSKDLTRDLIAGYKSRPKTTCLPRPGQIVAVKHPDHEMWHRGEIQATGMYYDIHCSNYEVFLLERGTAHTVKRENIWMMPRDPKYWQPRHTKKMQLYGIVPITMQMHLENYDTGFTQEFTYDWDESTYTFVAEQLSASKQFYMSTVNYASCDQNKIFGDIKYYSGDKLVSLTEELCRLEYGRMNESLFPCIEMKQECETRVQLSLSVVPVKHVHCKAFQRDLKHQPEEIIDEQNDEPPVDAFAPFENDGESSDGDNIQLSNVEVTIESCESDKAGSLRAPNLWPREIGYLNYLKLTKTRGEERERMLQDLKEKAAVRRGLSVAVKESATNPEEAPPKTPEKESSKTGEEEPKNLFEIFSRILLRKKNIELEQQRVQGIEERYLSLLEEKLSPWETAELKDDDLVVFNNAEHTNRMFVRLLANIEALDELQKEIQEYGSTKIVLEKGPILGSFCIGKYPEDNVWYRARVVSSIYSNRVELHFVDYGEVCAVSLADIKPMLNRFLTTLPIQAIECELADVWPCRNKIRKNALMDMLYILTIHENGDAKNLKVKLTSPSGSAKYTVGNYYSVYLTCVDEDEDINKKILDKLPNDLKYID